MNVTQNELAVLKALNGNFFSNESCDWVWSNCINDSNAPSGIEGKTLSGVVSSLCAKGLAEVDGNTGRDACIRLTEAGLAAIA